MLLEMDPNMVESILDDGHDWAQDHIAEAKIIWTKCLIFNE
jgi:hypothetical protein